MNRFYFDHNATTPISPEVSAAVWPMFTEVFGNASSIHHYGQVAKQKLEQARRQLASWLNCDTREIVFTSGGTEADNLALFGTVRGSSRSSKHVVTTSIEHPAVLSSCARLEREGVAVTYVPVGPSGVVDPAAIEGALRADTVLISVMHANNETGAVQPIEEISRIARHAGVPLHSDGVQAAGKIPVNLSRLGVDLYSISGHKLCAPKGIGALYVRKGTAIEPHQYGGRHEMGRRAGTENVPLAVGLGCAAEWFAEHGTAENLRLEVLRDRLEHGLRALVPDLRFNTAGSPRIPNTSNVLFHGIEGEAVVIALDLRGFAVSSGAACSSGAVEPSHVLTAIGLSKADARSCVRFSLGRTNSVEQVDALIQAVAESVAHLRKISPAYRVTCDV